MVFPSTLKDVNGVPISSVYIPGIGWGALMGGTSTTDGSGNVAAPACVVLYGTITNPGDTAVGVVGSSLKVNVQNSNQAMNLSQINTTTPDTNSGNKSAGTLRVVLATDQPTMSNVQPANVSQFNGQGVVLDNVNIPAFSMRAKGAAAGDTSVLVDTVFGGMAVEQFIQYHILAGHGYSLCTGQIASATNGSLYGGLDLVWNNIAKGVLIYTLTAAAVKGNAMTDAYLAYVASATADTAMTNSVASNIVNLQAGGSASSITTAATRAAGFTTDAQKIGTNFGEGCASANTVFNFLQNGNVIYIPKNTVAQYILYAFYSAAANTVACTAQWIEF